MKIKLICKDCGKVKDMVGGNVAEKDKCECWIREVKRPRHTGVCIKCNRDIEPLHYLCKRCYPPLT